MKNKKQPVLFLWINLLFHLFVLFDEMRWLGSGLHMSAEPTAAKMLTLNCDKGREIACFSKHVLKFGSLKRHFLHFEGTFEQNI